MKTKKNSIMDIISRSSTASCSPGERVMTVDKAKMSSVVRRLKNKGYWVEVTKPQGKRFSTNKRRIYFARFI